MSTNTLVSLYGTLCGSFFFGAILATAFYGFTSVQTFYYYVHYPGDPMRLKATVLATWMINTVHEALIVAGVYKYFMASLSDSASILKEPIELTLQLLPLTLSAILTQGFLVHRIYIFSRKRLITPVIWLLLGLVQIITVIIYIQKALRGLNGAQSIDLTVLGKSSLMMLGSVGLTVAAGEDILIAIVVTVLLFRERASTGFASTAQLLQRLMVFAVNAGTWTAIFAVAALVIMNGPPFPTASLYTIFLYPLCPVYCNTLLANLNGRAYISGQNETTCYVVDSPSQVVANMGSSKKRETGIWKTTEVVTLSDAHFASESFTAENV